MSARADQWDPGGRRAFVVLDVFEDFERANCVKGYTSGYRSDVNLFVVAGTGAPSGRCPVMVGSVVPPR